MCLRHRWRYYTSKTHSDAYGPLEHRYCTKCRRCQTYDNSPLFGGWKWG